MRKEEKSRKIEMKKLTDDDGSKDMTVHFPFIGGGAYTFFYYFLSVLPTICK
jgi:hypothetical protein